MKLEGKKRSLWFLGFAIESSQRLPFKVGFQILKCLYKHLEMFGNEAHQSSMAEIFSYSFCK